MNRLSFDFNEVVSVKANLGISANVKRAASYRLRSRPLDARGRSQNDFICAAKLDRLFEL
jgi:hypothetical protein